MQKVIQTIELTKIYKDFWGRGHVRALDGLNLDVNQGEVVGLLGPNGSGKTTTVKLLLGLLFPTKGVVHVFGKSPRDLDVKEKIGYMPEDSHLYDYLNAKETLDFFGRLFGLGREDRAKRADALIDMVGLSRARNRPVGEFSKGMARRIGLAQALINDPDLLILDEPTTGLDPIGAREMKDLIATLKERGKTVFLCSHLLSDVEQICDRFAILYGGKMRVHGTVNELLTESKTLQMKMPPIPSEGLEELKAVIRQYRHDYTDVEISHAERRLEDFFLKVVEDAKRERLVTAGAESGTGAAEFLSKAEEETESIIRNLTKAGKKDSMDAEKDSEKRVSEPQPVEKEDEDLIERLAANKLDSDENEYEQGKDKIDQDYDEGPEERLDMLEELIRRGRQQEEESEEKANDSNEKE